MKHRVTVLAILAVALLASFAMAAAHHPDKVMIDAAAAKQPGVEFPHAKHVEVVESCDTCHHNQEGLTAEQDVEVEKCSACHLDPEGDVPGMREMSLKKNPFHMACIDCHKERDKGPTKCNECHVK